MGGVDKVRGEDTMGPAFAWLFGEKNPDTISVETTDTTTPPIIDPAPDPIDNSPSDDSQDSVTDRPIIQDPVDPDPEEPTTPLTAFQTCIQNLEKECTNTFGIELVRIDPGRFLMGSNAGYDEDEAPAHWVEITKTFYIGKYEVTQAQWESVGMKNESEYAGENRPVENVTWNQTKQFTNLLSELETMTYRLPTEAEWEYAARAGTTTEYFWGDDWETYTNYAVANGNIETGTAPAGSKRPNDWGLYDMLGNVWEWVEDDYDADVYKSREGVTRDPLVKFGGGTRVLRGGSFNGSSYYVRCAYRSYNNPGLRNDYYGFRVIALP